MWNTAILIVISFSLLIASTVFVAMHVRNHGPFNIMACCRFIQKYIQVYITSQQHVTSRQLSLIQVFLIHTLKNMFNTFIKLSRFIRINMMTGISDCVNLKVSRVFYSFCYYPSSYPRFLP